jgi:hypothetical protein
MLGGGEFYPDIDGPDVGGILHIHPRCSPADFNSQADVRDCAGKRTATDANDTGEVPSPTHLQLETIHECRERGRGVE